MFRGLIVSIVIILSFQSCYYDNADELNPGTAICDTSGPISFNKHIKPLQLSRCGTTDLSCHNGNNSASLIDLTTYAGTVASANGTLMDALLHINGASPMPKNAGKLDDCSIALYQKWIEQGKFEN